MSVAKLNTTEFMAAVMSCILRDSEPTLSEGFSLSLIKYAKPLEKEHAQGPMSSKHTADLSTHLQTLEGFKELEIAFESLPVASGPEHSIEHHPTAKRA
eukprot:493497-Amphidinium_carterae.1